jgi:septal ring factor EnvC (AmiA/AmiB activator)
MLSFAKTVSEKLLAVWVVLVLVSLSSGALADEGAVEKGVVVPRYLNVREKPDKDSDSLNVLEQGQVIRIVRHTGNGWLEVELDGQKGFVRNRKRYVRLFREKSKQKIRREVVVTTPAQPESRVELEIEQRAKEMEAIGSKIEQHRHEIRAYTEKEAVIINGLNDIDRTLDASRRKLSATKAELDRLEAEIRINTHALDDLNRVIADNEQYIVRRLVALYKLNQIGKMNVLASADSVYGLINRRRAMEFILKADDRVLSDHLANVSRLTELKTRLSEQKSINLALTEDYRRQIGVIENNRQKKTALLEEIRQKKSLGLAAVQSLEDAARELDQTIRALDQGFDRSHRGLAGDLPFTARKGALKKPVDGRIISSFGKARDKTFNVETFHTGIKLHADRGEPIQAVGSGTVLFSDWLKGYGNLIIIDHGDNYYSLYGHTEEVFKKKGDRVEDREVIATVGDTGSLSGPGLHFEIRHRGEPVDPMAWFSKS